MKAAKVIWTSRKPLIVKIILLLIVVLTARQYADWTFYNPWLAYLIVMGLEDRPFAYRTLIPWLAQILVSAGLNPSQALTVMIVLSAIALVYGIKYLIASTRR